MTTSNSNNHHDVPDTAATSTPMVDPGNYFADLARVDCSAHVERKGRFSYLSWPFAVAELLTRHPDATWRVFETATGIPYFQSEAGAFVKVAVTVAGIERVQIHPILDGNNRPISTPDAFQVNTSIQRALVKAIALHGLGLYIYAGEDLPTAAGQPTRDDGPPGQRPSTPARAWAEQIGACTAIADLQQLWSACAASGALDQALRTAFTDRATTLKHTAA